jgi:copper transport protein
MCVPAHAHSLLRSTQPADGAQLTNPPSKIVLNFTEIPDPEVSSVQLLNSSGATVPTGKPTIVSGTPSALQVAVGHIGPGVYTVSWRGVSKVDGHVTAGSFSFGVGRAPPATSSSRGTTGASTTPNPTPASILGRWALYWGLALMLAAGVISRFVFRRDDPRVERGLAVAWIVALGGIAMMMLSARSTIGVGFAQFLKSRTGQNLTEQLVAVALCGVGVLLVILGRQSIGYLLTGAASLVAMWFHAVGSHAELHMTWFNVPVQFVHMVSVSIWVGGLLWLFVALRGQIRELVAEVHRFSTLAGIALAIVAITGTMRALDESGGIARWRDAVSSSFGITLLIKIALFVLLVVLAARNRYVYVPALAKDDRGSKHLVRTVGAEVLLAAAILGATGVLSQLPPPVDIADAASPLANPSNAVAVGHDFATSVRVKLTVTPGTPGRNTFQAELSDFDSGKPVAARGVTLGVALPSRADVGASSLKLTQKSDGVWTGTGTNLSLAGRWAITVTIQKTATALEVPLTLQTRTEHQHMTVQSVPGQPTVYSISLPTGGKLQTYVDPGHPGINNVHFTFFKSSGKEESIASARAVAMDPQGQRRRMKLIRFDKGHYVANQHLSPGKWTFEVEATTRAGISVKGHFSQSID